MLYHSNKHLTGSLEIAIDGLGVCVMSKRNVIIRKVINSLLCTGLYRKLNAESIIIVTMVDNNDK